MASQWGVEANVANSCFAGGHRRQQCIGLGTGAAPGLNLSFPKIISGRNGLRRRPTLQHVFRDGRLGDLKAEHNPRHRETFAGPMGLRSQQCFSAAQAAGKFKGEIVPIEVPGRKGATIFDTDEHNRPKTTLEALAALKPAFRKDGTITAGNAPGVNSGAAAVVLKPRASPPSSPSATLSRIEINEA
jgi:hypothetical protein